MIANKTNKVLSFSQNINFQNLFNTLIFIISVVMIEDLRDINLYVSVIVIRFKQSKLKNQTINTFK